ncbi:MAG: tetratricopeptide repeat protein [Acidimicrobiales bacterium]
MTSAETTSTAAPGFNRDPAAAIAALEAELAATPRRSRPHQHAAAAYRLGVAYAESPAGDPRQSLRRALSCYDVALDIFDSANDPVEHARVLNAAGAARRSLAETGEAAELFRRAVELLRGRDRDEELGAVLNNLGLARAEAGSIDLADEAYAEALDLFDTDTAQGRRARVATLHNRGQAKAQIQTPDAQREAIGFYRAALDLVDLDEAPYHYGLVLHSHGVALTTLAELDPDHRESLLREATSAFGATFGTFTRTGFPYQHAMAKYNCGNAWVALGSEQDLRRATGVYEDALTIFDPRLQVEEWKRTYAGLEKVEKRLAEVGERGSRADHFAILVSTVDREERASLLSDRLARLIDMPEPRRAAAMVEWAAAVDRLGYDRTRLVLEAELELLTTVPQDALRALLQGQMDARPQVDEELRVEADRALDDAVGWTLNGPQRVYVRDFLLSLGFERP